VNRFSLRQLLAALPACIVLALFSLAAAPRAAAQTDGFTESVILNVGLDGSNPSSGVIQAADGNFYGTTSSGGSQYDGALYKVTPSGTASIVYSFCVQTHCTDGQSPGGVIQGTDGNFYGTTTGGGANYAGVAYKITPSGTYKVLYAFCAVYTTVCTDGINPGALVQGTDGNFYGVAGGGPNTYGASNQGGIVFQLTPAGKLTVLHNFCSQTGCADGGLPSSGLLQASDGNFYGTAASGGVNGGGVAYKISSSGAFSVIYSFCYMPGAGPCADGPGPNGTLVEAKDGSFYGVTSNGGPNTGDGNGYGAGTIFKLTSGGGLTTLYDFCSQANCTDGYEPGVGLYLASDGNFYGSTVKGNVQPDGDGVIYQLSGTTFTPVYIFCSQRYCADGESPSGLIQGADGALYGATGYGGAYSDGTVFKLAHTPALKAPVQLTLGASSITLGSSTSLSWSVSGAYSETLQQCYAFVQNGATGAGSTWTGKNPGGGTTDGSVTIKPTAGGSFTYALTCGGIESGFATLTVTKPPSTTALTATPTSLSVGQSATLKATVTGSAGTPTGNVVFSADGETLATVPLNSSGVASLTASTNGIAPATYPVIATYSGSTTYNGSASSKTDVTLTPAPTATTLTASPTSVTPPASVTLTATVKRSATGATGTPTGSVTFYADGGTALGTVKLNASGVASVTASSNGYPANTYAITAKYTGDSSDIASTSTAVSVTVK
jgi:uncharacterized repeat protein (TIGR03803 family)